MYSLGWPGTHYVSQAGLEPIESHPLTVPPSAETEGVRQPLCPARLCLNALPAHVYERNLCPWRPEERVRACMAPGSFEQLRERWESTGATSKSDRCGPLTLS